MIVSVDLADVGPLRAQRLLFAAPVPQRVPGLTSAEPALTAPLGERLPHPSLGRIGLIAAWERDEAIDGPSTASIRPAAGRRLAHPLQPLRCSAVGSDARTAGRGAAGARRRAGGGAALAACALRARPLRSGAPAERDAVADPAMIASTGSPAPPYRGRPTFSIWRSAAAMREYAFGSAGSHQAAVRADRARPFHHESAFVRFRPTPRRALGRPRPTGGRRFDATGALSALGVNHSRCPLQHFARLLRRSSGTRIWRGPAARNSGMSKPAARWTMLGMPCSASRPWIISASIWFWA